MTQSFYIAIPLPKQIKHSIHMLRYGLPNTEWSEEDNLFLFLQRIENINEQQLLDLYPSKFKIWDFDFEKASGCSDRKSPNIRNMRRLTIAASRELSLCQKPNFELTWV
jgi:hypothetical protein